MTAVPPQPTLTDGVVVLRPWRDEDIDEAIDGHDEEMARWFGWAVDAPSPEGHRHAIANWRAGYDDGRRLVCFVVEAEG
ncbi:MAG: NUDIX hydrolase, partial [Nocardioidaceae bacterium]